ncbi:DUF5696 domain-containing protein [Fundicoccus sp. Sow4_H7]|uniref:DUF5696 domain-containing protein n=1 Tax=Fundicoccus sp. Sow4_H7 TaxID=3438784 RepID=UPI003F92E758
MFNQKTNKYWRMLMLVGLTSQWMFTPLSNIFAQEELDDVEIEEIITEEDIEENVDSGLIDTDESKITQFNDRLDGFDLMAENDQFQLYVEPTSLAIKVINTADSYTWSSTLDDMDNERLNATWQAFVASAITAEIITADNKTATENILSEGTTIDLVQMDDGFQADIVLPSELALRLVVSLTDQGISVDVPVAHIVENENARLMQLTIYPFLGATKEASVPGYIFVPDGSGALINYQNDNLMRSPYVSSVYGQDAGIRVNRLSPEIKVVERVHMPVFGAVHGHGQHAMLGIINDGDTYAQIEAQVAGLATDFNWVTSNFIYRHSYQQPTNSSGSQTVNLFTNPMNRFNVNLEYHFLSEEDASYVGMALDYQQYLVEKGVLSPLENPANMMRLEFLGGETEQGLIFDSYITMTTISQMRDILNKYLEQDMKELEVVYRGWNIGGMSQNLPNKFPVANQIGSVAELEELQADLSQHGIDISFYADYVSATTVAAGVNANNYAQQVNSQDIEILKEELPVNLMLPNGSYELAMRDVAQYQDSHIHHLAIDRLGQELFATFNPGNQFTREVTKRLHQALVADLSSAMGNKLNFYDANAYVWEWTDSIYDISMKHSNYTYFSDVVPFMQIVLKGYVNYYAPFANFSADQTQNLLQNIEYGALPSFILTQENPILLIDTPSSDLYTTQADGWHENIVHYYQQYLPVYEATRAATITSRELLANGVVEVGYSNGVNIVINYTNEAFTNDSFEVAAMDYLILEGVE